jgi:HEAT repeat protein
MESTKEGVYKLKRQDIGAFLRGNTATNAHIQAILENLGRLPANFDSGWLVKLLGNESSSIRFLAVKNLGKLENDSFLEILNEVATNDSDTNVRREAVSAIGRLHKPNSKKILFDKLKDAPFKNSLEKIISKYETKLKLIPISNFQVITVREN